MDINVFCEVLKRYDSRVMTVHRLLTLIAIARGKKTMADTVEIVGDRGTSYYSDFRWLRANDYISSSHEDGRAVQRSKGDEKTFSLTHKGEAYVAYILFNKEIKT